VFDAQIRMNQFLSDRPSLFESTSSNAERMRMRAIPRHGSLVRGLRPLNSNSLAGRLSFCVDTLFGVH